MASTKYYSLMFFNRDYNEWEQVFGDYERSTVVLVKQADYQGFRTRIISSGDRQHEINEAIEIFKGKN